MKSIYLAFALILAATLAQSAQMKSVVLAKGQVAKSAIYITPELAKQSESALMASVNDLSHYLGEISGAKIEVITGSPAPGSKLLPILIGDLAVQAFGEPGKKSPYKQGWRLVVSGKGIGMIGESDDATSYAIYEFLDRLGCRWYMPSAMGEVIPRMKNLKAPAMDISDVPKTLERIIWFADDNYKRRNRLGGVHVEAHQGLELNLTKEQLEAHPDWNAEIGGKRSVNGRICWANPEVVQAIADKIIANFDAGGPRTASLSPNDGIAFCECAKCKALDTGDWENTMGCTSITDRLIHFCNGVAEKVTAKYPDALLGVYAYVQYTRPPLKEKVHPSIVPIVAPITYCRAHSMDDKDCPTRQELRKIMEGWLKASKNVGWYEFGWNLGELSAPFPLITKWGEDLRFLFDRGMNLWTPETQATFDTSLPGTYLGMRMSIYQDAKPGEVMDEFYTKFYGPAAKDMKTYWTIFDDAWTKVPEHSGSAFGHERRFTTAVLQAGRIAMDDALAACKPGSVEYQRVQLANERLRQFEAFMAMQRKLFVFYTGQYDLAYDSQVWMQKEMDFSLKYQDQYAFTYVGYGPGYPKSTAYFLTFQNNIYKEATRIAQNYTLLTNLGFPIREWKYRIDRNNEGEAQEWYKQGFDGAPWKTTDVCVETWSALGLYDYFGAVWYGYHANLPDVAPNKKVYLWFSRNDGNIKLFVNGQHVPYVNGKGETAAEFNGYCAPASFDITAAMVPGNTNNIVVKCTRADLNELGDGGLMGPSIIYAEK